MREVELRRLLSIIALVACIITWCLDLAELVVHCIYCRTIRTIVGIMGILMWHRFWTRKFTPFIFYPLAFLGAHVAAAQVFLHVQHANYKVITFYFSTAALLFIIGVMLWAIDHGRFK